jgi:hypothetical protein
MRALLTLLLLPLACVSANLPAPGDDAGTTPPPTASSYCEASEPFFCAYYARCGRMTGVTTPDECRALFLEQCESRYEPRYVALEEAGLLRLDAAGLEACGAHLAQVPCEEQIRDLDGPCAGMWVGQQPAGEPCGFDLESLVCAPGADCVLNFSLCGECRPLAQPGEPCGANAAGATCGSDARCDDGTCVARIAAGVACGPDDRCVLGARCEAGRCRGPDHVDEGESCDQVRRCRYGLRCASGVCFKDALLGEACGGELACTTGYCGPSGTCEALLPPEATCSASAQCVSGLCLSGRCGSMPGACFDDD